MDRYLLRELLVPLWYCLSGFLLLWVVSDLITELNSLQEKKLHLGDIAQYYLIKVPEFLVLVLPIALLLALLYALTNHARHNEITAIRAAGISLWRLSLPYFAVGLLLSLAVFWLNEYCVPQSADAAEQVRNSRLPAPVDSPARDKVLNAGINNSRDGRDWVIGMYDVRTGEMQRPVVDASGIPGTFNFKLEWTAQEDPLSKPPDANETAGPSIFTALQEQLGLKLESGKGPVEIIVVDHAEKPTEN